MILRWRKIEYLTCDPYLAINFSNKQSIKCLKTAQYNLIPLVAKKKILVLTTKLGKTYRLRYIIVFNLYLLTLILVSVSNMAIKSSNKIIYLQPFPSHV